MDRIAAEARTRLAKAVEDREEGASEGLQVAIIGGITGAAALVLAIAFRGKMEQYWGSSGL